MAKNRYNSNDYPKDMDDPRWFDREYGKSAQIAVPNWFTGVVFISPLIVACVGVLFLTVGGALELAGLVDLGLFKQ